MVLGITLNEMLTRIGHDGSEIIWPELPEPQRRRTFHIQECLAVALRLGFGTTELQFGPSLTPDGQRLHEVTPPIDIRWLMSISTGVLYGRGRVTNHVVAWDGQKVYDPNGTIYDIENQSHFTPSSYYLICQRFAKF